MRREPMKSGGGWSGVLLGALCVLAWLLCGCSSGSSARRVSTYLTFAGVVLLTEAEIRAEELPLDELRSEQQVVDGVLRPALDQIDMGLDHYAEVLQREIDERISQPPTSPGVVSGGLRACGPIGPRPAPPPGKTR